MMEYAKTSKRSNINVKADTNQVLTFLYLLNCLEDASGHDLETVFNWAEYILISGTGATHKKYCEQSIAKRDLVVPRNTADNAKNPKVKKMSNREMRKNEKKALRQMFINNQDFQEWRAKLFPLLSLKYTRGTSGVCTCRKFFSERMTMPNFATTGSRRRSVIARLARNILNLVLCRQNVKK